MTLSITHTTPADGTFSTTGAAAWDAAHSLGGVADISQGGTGATTAATARTALGLGTIATQAANSVAVTGGAIDGTTVGSTTAAAGAFTTLNSSGATQLGGAAGNQSLQVNNVASAVNYAQIVGAITNAAPTISAAGSDTNIGLIFTPKGNLGVSIGSIQPSSATFQLNAATGNNEIRQYVAGVTRGQIITTNTLQYFVNGGTGNQLFYMNSATQFAVSPTASAVNYLQATGAATGNAPTISAQGSDTNINLRLTTKGTGVLQFGTYTAGIIAQTGYITITDAGGTSRRLLVG